jgi:hypothetical protein
VSGQPLHALHREHAHAGLRIDEALREQRQRLLPLGLRERRRGLHRLASDDRIPRVDVRLLELRQQLDQAGAADHDAGERLHLPVLVQQVVADRVSERGLLLLQDRRHGALPGPDGLERERLELLGHQLLGGVERRFERDAPLDARLLLGAGLLGRLLVVVGAGRHGGQEQEQGQERPHRPPQKPS